MNWMQHPQLFCTGNFKAIDNQWDDPQKPAKIIGYSGRFDSFILEDDSEEGYFADVNYCQLIARKIEGMTNEEKENCKEFTDKAKFDSGLYYEHYWEMLIYILSIGVYPFDQSHFEDGTVLDSREL